MSSNLILIFSLIVLTSVFDTINQLFLKTSIDSIDVNIISLKTMFKFILKLIFIPRVWIGFIFCCLSLFVWLFVLSLADLNFAFSVDSMHYIFIALASRLILKEKVYFKRWVGTIFIVIGIILVTLSGNPA